MNLLLVIIKVIFGEIFDKIKIKKCAPPRRFEPVHLILYLLTNLLFESYTNWATDSYIYICNYIHYITKVVK